MKGVEGRRGLVAGPHLTSCSPPPPPPSIKYSLSKEGVGTVEPDYISVLNRRCCSRCLVGVLFQLFAEPHQFYCDFPD